MQPGMYIFINKGLGMSPGKIAAQAGHAAVEALRLSQKCHGSTWEDSNLVRMWYKGGHYAKYVMEARDAEHLRDIERYLNDRGFSTSLILDEGRTEVPCISPTALGVEIVDRDDPHVQATFSSFDLYKEPRAFVVESARKLTSSAWRELHPLVQAGDRDAVTAWLREYNHVPTRREKRRAFWRGFAEGMRG